MTKPMWFKCDGCGHLFPLSQRTIVKAKYTAFDADSLKSLQYFIYHVQLCSKCVGVKEGEAN